MIKHQVERVCVVPDCFKRAVAAPVIKMWAQRCDRSQHEPMLGQIDVGLCAQHAADAKVEDFLTDDVYNLVADRMEALGHEAPDRVGAEIEMVPL